MKDCPGPRDSLHEPPRFTLIHSPSGARLATVGGWIDVDVGGFAIEHSHNLQRKPKLDGVIKRRFDPMVESLLLMLEIALLLLGCVLLLLPSGYRHDLRIGCPWVHPLDDPFCLFAVAERTPFLCCLYPTPPGILHTSLIYPSVFFPSAEIPVLFHPRQRPQPMQRDQALATIPPHSCPLPSPCSRPWSP